MATINAAREYLLSSLDLAIAARDKRSSSQAVPQQAGIRRAIEVFVSALPPGPASELNHRATAVSRFCDGESEFGKCRQRASEALEADLAAFLAPLKSPVGNQPADRLPVCQLLESAHSLLGLPLNWRLSNATAEDAVAALGAKRLPQLPPRLFSELAQIESAADGVLLSKPIHFSDRCLEISEGTRADVSDLRTILGEAFPRLRRLECDGCFWMQKIAAEELEAAHEGFGGRLIDSRFGWAVIPKIRRAVLSLFTTDSGRRFEIDVDNLTIRLDGVQYTVKKNAIRLFEGMSETYPGVYTATKYGLRPGEIDNKLPKPLQSIARNPSSAIWDSGLGRGGCRLTIDPLG